MLKEPNFGVQKFILEYGINGGYNDTNYCFFEGTRQDAEDESRRLAEELFYSYGIHDQEIENTEDGEDLIEYSECFENWSEYLVHDYTVENLKKFYGYGYKNDSYTALKNSGFEPLEDLVDDHDFELI